MATFLNFSQVTSSPLSFPVFPPYFIGLLRREGSVRHLRLRAVYLQPHCHYEIIKERGLDESQMFVSDRAAVGAVISLAYNAKQLLLGRYI